jgi:hypothetical protein
MGNTRILKRVLNGKFHGRRPVGRQRLRWEDTRSDSSLLLNIRGWWRLAGNRNIWGQPLKIQSPTWAVCQRRRERKRFHANVA